MPEYSFLNLSPAEFEELTRDLLQQELKIHLESFSNGRDGGIDFRHCYPKSGEMIIQCKRFKDYKSLYSKLRDELPKLVKLKPRRYVLSTSASLTPKNKKEIFDLLKPFLKTPSDIYGKDDLNNLLGKFPQIEKQHFKLWLSSVNILERILHSRIFNQSSFEEDHVKETVKLYVNNSSHTTAKDLIDHFNYVIISGAPGIGKTTLARILSYEYLANGYEEFVFLSESIDDAYALFREEAKQVFLFDDFLGKTFLDKKLKNNEDQRIIRFIEKIKKSENKILIMTTREYILAQAKLRYDMFENDAIDIAKCVIDLAQYTKVVRAKILYNHLFFANVGEDYIQEMLNGKSYNKIISHPNYSPRIIQTIFTPSVLKTIPVNKFIERFLAFLDYPESIWKHVYENQITNFSQIILANLMTLGAPIHFNNLKHQTKVFADKHAVKYGITYSEIDYNKAVRELENTFIKTERDSIGTLIVNYLNPSVQDFLVNYFYEMPDYLTDIFGSAIFINQFFDLFTLRETSPLNKKGRKSQIKLTDSQIEIIVENIVNNFDALKSSRLKKATFTNTTNFQWYAEKCTVYSKISDIMGSGLVTKKPVLESMIVEKFQAAIIPQAFHGDDQNYYISIFLNYQDQLDFQDTTLLKAYSNTLSNLYDFSEFLRLKDSLAGSFETFVSKDEEFLDSIKDIVEFEAENAEDHHLEELIAEIKGVTDETGLNFDDVVQRLNEKWEDSKENYESDYDDDYERYATITDVSESQTDISDMFDSLK
ncbi:restriction endonuclease [Pedobacter soli]|uniref:Holliday junction DNA helicase ruvB N-terminus n=1 Tax=Pedobacter soli TaxID=390242 RepID=A0A1G6JX96_9SPHI|nr:restriction endonuclease [Pedobacter soli]SDC23344.1 Holliday junction DNA helicase ruvB N-terminus [Pedobacter soli]